MSMIGWKLTPRKITAAERRITAALLARSRSTPAGSGFRSLQTAMTAGM